MQIDPKFMDDELGIKKEDRIVENVLDDSELRALAESYSDYEEELNESVDRVIFPGGPTVSMVDSWKKQFGEVYMTAVGNDGYVWRLLNRIEYKSIVSVPNSDPLIREEMICETCVLWPQDYTVLDMGSGKAGVPSILAEQIMEKSGFTRVIMPQML